MIIMKESDEVAKENVTFQVSPIVQPKPCKYGSVDRLPQEWTKVQLNFFPVPGSFAVATAFLEYATSPFEAANQNRTKVFLISGAMDAKEAYRMLKESGHKISGPYSTKVGLQMVEDPSNIEIPRTYEQFTYKFFNDELEE